jgi:hypothetical protein
MKGREMHKARHWLIRLGGVAIVALALAAAAAAATVGHDHFTSDPYPDEWCGIVGTSVDRVVSNYTDSRESLDVRTTFSDANGTPLLEIRSTGVRKDGPPIDNGNGTYSEIFTNAGQSPSFKIPNGPTIGNDVGLVQFRITFDSATGNFVGFDVVKVAGQREALDAQVCAALQ